MPEKLLTIKEVADYLKISEEEVKRLVDAGEIPAYRIGDTFLRFRKEQLDAVRNEISEVEAEEAAAHPAPVTGRPAHPGHPYTDLEKDIKRKEPAIRQFDYTLTERISDFFYFNDFYILSFIIIAVLMYLIFRS